MGRWQPARKNDRRERPRTVVCWRRRTVQAAAARSGRCGLSVPATLAGPVEVSRAVPAACVVNRKTSVIGTPSCSKRCITPTSVVTMDLATSSGDLPSLTNDILAGRRRSPLVVSPGWLERADRLPAGGGRPSGRGGQHPPRLCVSASNGRVVGSASPGGRVALRLVTSRLGCGHGQRCVVSVLVRRARSVGWVSGSRPCCEIRRALQNRNQLLYCKR